MLKTNQFFLWQRKSGIFSCTAVTAGSSHKRDYSSRRVVVTGIGIICPVGYSSATAWRNVIEGVCGIEKLAGDQYKALPCRVAGIISRGESEGQFDVSKHFNKSALKTMAPASSLALIAAEEALTDAKWKPDDERLREKTGVTFGMGMIDLQDVCNTNDSLNLGYNKVSPYFVPRILPNMAAGQISIKYGFRGPNHSVSTACATGAHSIGDGFRFIKHNDADVMVCGAAEACISPLSIAGFCRLRALSTSFNDTPKQASRPFDKSRDGFVMGEGSAVLILEEYQHAVKRGVNIYCEILGYGLSGDASHITSPREDGSGAILSMSRALNEANVKSSDVGYINAHATSTPLGDTIEARAIATLMASSENLQGVSSTKGAHGHLLGAAGNLEMAFTVLACHHGIMPPTINMTECDVMPLNYVPNKMQSWETTSRRIALKNSFGFGGTNATLCLAAL